MLNALDLFSGIGGFSLGLKGYAKTIAYCENDPHAQGVLLSRMRDGRLDRAPICTDIKTLRGRDLHQRVDIITGGFPCQDISCAGRGAGLGGERSGLFFEIVRLVEEIAPPFVFLENVPAIRTRGLEQVLKAFTDLRYDTRWTVVSAGELGAPHLRKRWFLLAHANGVRLRKERRPEIRRDHAERSRPFQSFSPLVSRSNPDADRFPKKLRRAEKREQKPFDIRSLEGFDWNDPAAFFLRMDHGFPFRVDRHRRVGNSVVPAQAREAFERLMGL